MFFLQTSWGDLNHPLARRRGDRMGPRTLGGATGSLSHMYANARDFRQGEGTGTRMARSATSMAIDTPNLESRDN